MPARLNKAFPVVLFDLDGTLRFNQPSSTKAFYDYAAGLGLPDGREQRRSAIQWTHAYWANSSDLSKDLQAFPEDEAFWGNYAVRGLLAFGCTPEVARELAPDINRYMREEHRPLSWTPPETLETLALLRAAGVRLGVLSNRDKPCQDELTRLGLLEYFELALVAAEVGAWKPDPQIFLRTLERMNVSADQVLYVGDNYYADVIGAQSAGVTPVLLDPDEVFPEADCTVIRSLREIPALIGVG